jgi:ABC-type branched-subunit amino acid transport system substrate-binding protein
LIAHVRQRNVEAITALQHSVDTSTNAEVAAQARADILRLVREHLTSDELEQLALQYPDTYPGDIILLQLAQHYQDAGADEKEREVLQRFATNFPEYQNTEGLLARQQELQSETATEPNKIGVLLPLSGDGGFYGQRALQGIELALTIVQERHASSNISLVVRDIREATEASAALHALAEDQRVLAVIGPLFSQIATALAPLSEQLALPLISPYAPEGQFTTLSSYAFRNSLTDVIQGRFLADYAVRVLGLRRFAVLHSDDPYSIGLKDAFVAHVLQRQGEVLAVLAYAADATDFSQPIKALGGADEETLHDLRVGAGTPATDGTTPAGGAVLPYEALFIPDYYDKISLIAPTLALYNITNVQLLGSDGWNAPELVRLGKGTVEGTVFVDGFFAASPAPLVQEFVERFRSRYGKEPDLLAAQAYDTLLLLAEVLATGATTRQQIRDGLRTIRNFPGVSGTTSMLATGEAEKIPYLLSIRNGRILQLN